MGISALLLAYQEADNLRWLLPELKQQLDGIGEDYEILVVDTQETLDDTQEVCRQNGVRHLRRDRPEFGAAMRFGIACACMDKLLILDADGSHRPEYIPAMHRRFLEGADIVIGSRYTKGGSTRDKPLSVLQSKLLGAICHLLLGLRARDISTDFRIYDMHQLKAVEPTGEHFDIVPELLVRLQMRNPALRIAEVPIAFDRRRYGKTKRDMPAFVLGYLRTFTRLIALRLRGNDRTEESHPSEGR